MSARFEVRRGRTGLWRFVLIAHNGEIIATSQHYKTRAGARKGVRAVESAVRHGERLRVVIRG